MRGFPRLPTDVLFVLGIGGGVAFTVAFSLGVWFFIGGADIDANGARIDAGGDTTPRPDATNLPPLEPGISDEVVLFGQSAAYSGPAEELGTEMGRGIRAAFNEVNEVDGVHGRDLLLESLDDFYEPESAIRNTLQLIEQESIFALIGAVGTPTSRSAVPIAEARGVPYIAPFTGAAFLRDPELATVVNLRASYNQETEEMVERLNNDLGIERIGIMYQDDSFGRAGYRGVISALERRGMEPAAVGLYTRNTLAVKTALLDLNQGSPQAVVLVGAYEPVAELIAWARHTGLDAVFMTVSFVGSNALAEELGPDGAGVFVTQVVPFPTDDSIPIVASYLNALSASDPDAVPGFVSLEGYLAGRLVIAALEICGRDVDRACFLDSLRSKDITGIGGFELNFGYQDNQGSDAVFITVIGPDGRYHPIDNLRDVPQ